MFTLLSVNLSAQDEKISYSDRASTKENVESKESTVIVYHNNNPSDQNNRDFTWSLEGFTNDASLKLIVSKLQSNPYFKNILILDSGIESKKYIQFTLTAKYDESKVFSSFESAGVTHKKALDQLEVKKIKE